VDFTGLLTRFGTGTYTVTRTARGTTVRGRLEDAVETEVEITASVSPASGKDMESLPEGRNVNDVRLLFTTTELLVGGQGEDYEADVVTIGSSDFEVIHVEPWLDPGTSNYMYRCIVSLI
jgi:hypothetical protein